MAHVEQEQRKAEISAADPVEEPVRSHLTGLAAGRLRGTLQLILVSNIKSYLNLLRPDRDSNAGPTA